MASRLFTQSFRRGNGAALVIAFLCLALSSLARGASVQVTLAWDPDTGANVTGYNVYYGTVSHNYPYKVSAGNATTATIIGLTAGTRYFFAVTAYDSSGMESVYSTEVSFTPTVPPPGIVLSSPVSGAVYTAPATITLAATVTANGHTITKVQFYNGTTLLGESAASPYSYTWNNVGTNSYSLKARAIYDSGSTVDSSAASVSVGTSPPAKGLTFTAVSGTISAPFVSLNGTILQSVLTTLTGSGRASYNFALTNPGNYYLSVSVNAPSLSENSCYVNIDAEPTDPLMIWDIPVTSGVASLPVTWRGTGSDDPATAQFKPKVFSLAAGAHQLIIRGREPNVALSSITLFAMPPILRPRVIPSGGMALDGNGQPGQTYDVMASSDLGHWAAIGTVTVAANGSLSFADLGAATNSIRYYRLRQTP